MCCAVLCCSVPISAQQSRGAHQNWHTFPHLNFPTLHTPNLPPPSTHESRTYARRHCASSVRCNVLTGRWVARVQCAREVKCSACVHRFLSGQSAAACRIAGGYAVWMKGNAVKQTQATQQSERQQHQHQDAHLSTRMTLHRVVWDGTKSVGWPGPVAGRSPSGV